MMVRTFPQTELEFAVTYNQVTVGGRHHFTTYRVSSDTYLLSRVESVLQTRYGLRLDISLGPWIAGGACWRSLIGGEVAPEYLNPSRGPDIDVFFLNDADFLCWSVTLMSSVGSQLRHLPVSGHSHMFRLQLGHSSVLLQLIRPSEAYLRGTLENILSQFDFRVCAMAYSGGTLTVVNNALTDLANREIAVLSPAARGADWPERYIRRFTRFNQLGFCGNRSAIIRLGYALSVLTGDRRRNLFTSIQNRAPSISL